MGISLYSSSHNQVPLVTASGYGQHLCSADCLHRRGAPDRPVEAAAEETGPAQSRRARNGHVPCLPCGGELGNDYVGYVVTQASDVVPHLFAAMDDELCGSDCGRLSGDHRLPWRDQVECTQRVGSIWMASGQPGWIYIAEGATRHSVKIEHSFLWKYNHE